MNNHTNLLQTVPAWLGVGVSHFAQNITLSNIASVCAILYSVVGVWFMLRKNRAPHDD